MIAKERRGPGFRGGLNYVLAPEDAPQIVGGNRAGRDARKLPREFGRTRQLRPDVGSTTSRCPLLPTTGG